MAKNKATVEIELGTKKSLKSLGEMKSSLDDLQDKIEQTTDPTEFSRLSREFSKLDSQIKTTEESMQGLSMEQLTAEVGNFATGLGDALGGAILLFGATAEEAESVNRAIAQGLGIMQAVQGGVQTFISLQKIIKSTTSTQMIFNAVLTANPIGIIVVAIGALVAGLIIFQDEVEKAINWFDNLGVAAKIVIGILAGPLLVAIYAVRKALISLGIIETQQDKERARIHEEQVKRLKQQRKELDKVIEKQKEQQELETTYFDNRERQQELIIDRMIAEGATEQEISEQKKKLRQIEIDGLQSRELLLQRNANDTKKAFERTLTESERLGNENIRLMNNLEIIRDENGRRRLKNEDDILNKIEELEKESVSTFDEIEKRKLDIAKQSLIDYYNTTVERVELSNEMWERSFEKQTANIEEETAKREEAQERYREWLQEQEELRLLLEDLRAENIKDEEIRELEQERLRYERLRIQYKGHTEILQQLHIQHLQKIAEINEEYSPILIEPIKENANEIENVQIDSFFSDAADAATTAEPTVVEFSDSWMSMTDRVKAGLSAFSEETEAIIVASTMGADAIGNVFSSLGTLIGEETAKGAALQKASALISILTSTARSIAETIAGAASASAAGGPAAPFLLATYIASGISTVMAGIASAKQVFDQANAVSIPGFGGGGASSPSISTPTPDTTTLFGTSGISGGDSEQFGNQNLGERQTIKAVVVESDITSTQQRLNQYKQRSEIG